jgi:hypothetical protein
MNPMSLLTLPSYLLSESYHHPQPVPSHGERDERLLALAVALASFFAALLLVFA